MTQLILLAVLVAGIGLYAWSVPQGGRAWWWLAGTSAAFALAAVALSDSVRSAGTSWMSPILLDVGELAAVALVWSHGTAEAARTGRRYLAAIGPAIACTLIGAGLVERAVPLSAGVEKVALCLLVVGFALKLGLIPVYFWLPEVAPSVTTVPRTAASRTWRRSSAPRSPAPANRPRWSGTTRWRPPAHPLSSRP